MNPAALLRLARPDRPDGELLAAFAADRDEAAFAELVRRHGPLVWGVCRRMLPNPADAEDAFQASFLVLVRRADRLTAAGTVGPWQHRVAVLTARDLRKRSARRAARLSPLPADLPAPPVPASDVDDLLLGLPDRYRAAVVLCCLEGLTQRQAAERLGVPEGTLSARLSRGLAKLRTKFTGTLPAAVAVPAVLSDTTAKAATAVSLAAAVSPTVLKLTEGVVRMFLLKKASALAGCVLAVGLTIGVGTRFGPAAADEPKPEPVAKAAELERRIAALKLLQSDLETKRREVDQQAKRAGEWAAEIIRLEEEKAALTASPAAVAESETASITVAVQAGDLPHFTVYEKNAKGLAHSISQIFTDAALRRHLARMRTDTTCPKTITLLTGKDAKWVRVEAAVAAVKAAGFASIQAEVETGRASRPDERSQLEADVAELSDAVVIAGQMAKRGLMTEAQLDAKRSQLTAALDQLRTVPRQSKDRTDSRLLTVGEHTFYESGNLVESVGTAIDQEVVDAQIDLANRRRFIVYARKPGVAKLTVKYDDSSRVPFVVWVRVIAKSDTTDVKPVAPPRLALAPIRLAVHERATVAIPGKPIKAIVSGGMKVRATTSNQFDAHLIGNRSEVVVTGRKPGKYTLVVEADDGTQAEVTVTVTE